MLCAAKRFFFVRELKKKIDTELWPSNYQSTNDHKHQSGTNKINVEGLFSLMQIQLNTGAMDKRSETDLTQLVDDKRFVSHSSI